MPSRPTSTAVCGVSTPQGGAYRLKNRYKWNSFLLLAGLENYLCEPPPKRGSRVARHPRQKICGKSDAGSTGLLTIEGILLPEKVGNDAPDNALMTLLEGLEA
jgi:hypothetical protein